MAARFMSTVNDGLLLEILIRLPKMGPAITVCRSWHSLLISDHPYAFLRHTLHHHHRRQSGDPDPSYTPPCTLLIGYEPRKPCVEILCEKSKILEAVLSRQSPQRNLLGFVSSWNSASINSSFNDSLLIDLNGHNCIYNVVTREQRMLPDAPPPERTTGVNSILVGREDPNGKFQFRVVKFIFHTLRTTKRVTVFSTETGEWSESVLNLGKLYPWEPAIAAGGAIHWRHTTGIVVYDPFRPPNDPSSCRIVECPFERQSGPDFDGAVWYLLMGAVRGRLRLLGVVLVGKDIRLTIWELDGDDKWSLVRQVRLDRGSVSRLSMVAFHPDDGDVIFLIPEGTTEVYRCELKTKRLVAVGLVSIDLRTNFFTHHIRDFSLVHSWF